MSSTWEDKKVISLQACYHASSCSFENDHLTCKVHVNFNSSLTNYLKLTKVYMEINLTKLKRQIKLIDWRNTYIILTFKPIFLQDYFITLWWSEKVAKCCLQRQCESLNYLDLVKLRYYLSNSNILLFLSLSGPFIN